MYEDAEELPLTSIKYTEIIMAVIKNTLSIKSINAVAIGNVYSIFATVDPWFSSILILNLILSLRLMKNELLTRFNIISLSVVEPS